MKLEALSLFVAIAEARSISAAALRLGLPKSVASERLMELERSLGTKLVERSTRSLSLTEDGAAFLQRARRMLREMAEAIDEIASRRGTLTGRFRLSGPVSFGALHLGPALFPFLAEHPQLELTLELDDRLVDIASEGFDAVVRHGPLRDTRLTATRLATSRRLLVASPAYLSSHGRPASLRDLEAAAGIIYTNREVDWRFRTRKGEAFLRPRTQLRVNNGLLMRDAALAGLGIALLPTFFVHRELAAGELVHIDVGAEAEGAEILFGYRPGGAASAKTQALYEHLRQTFGDPPYWDRPPARRR